MIQSTKLLLKARPDTVPLFRKNLIFPSEHGAWSWLLVPFVAASIASRSMTFPAVLILLSGLSLFLMRQPASILVRIYSGKSNASLFVSAALWACIFGSVGLLSFVGLLVLGRDLLLVLLLPAALLSFLYLLAAKQGRSGIRSAATELMGSAGLALMAPATWIAINNEWPALATLLLILMALQNVLSVLYVRFRLAAKHHEEQNRVLLILPHIIVLVLVPLTGQWMLVLPFAFFAVRSLIIAWKNPSLVNVKRFGFLELAIQFASGVYFGLTLSSIQSPQ